ASEVDSLLRERRVARVAADPACVPSAAEPGGYDRIVYYRLHGSPRTYYSAYLPEVLADVARVLDEKAAQGITTWCIFDNTALGAATTDALTVKSLLPNYAARMAEGNGWPQRARSRARIERYHDDGAGQLCADLLRRHRRAPTLRERNAAPAPRSRFQGSGSEAKAGSHRVTCRLQLQAPAT